MNKPIFIPSACSFFFLALSLSLTGALNVYLMTKKKEMGKLFRFSCFTLDFLPLYYFFPRMSMLFSQDVFVSELLFDNSLISLSFLFFLSVSLFSTLPNETEQSNSAPHLTPIQKEKKRKKNDKVLQKIFFNIV